MITIAGIDFDYLDYDERGDVLFLHVGKPSEPPAKAFETPEGHTVEYDEHGAVVGLELMGVRRTVEGGGELQLTWPPAQVAASELLEAIAARSVLFMPSLDGAAHLLVSSARGNDGSSISSGAAGANPILRAAATGRRPSTGLSR